MAKKFNFSRLLFRNGKKSSNAANDQVKTADSTTKKEQSCPIPAKSTSSSSNKSNTNRKEQTTDSILKVSKQKQQHLLSLLKYSNADMSDDFLTLNDIPPEQQSLYLLRLYLATVQKLKRYQPNSMEKQKAVYGLLSCLVIQQELDRFDAEFEPVGRKPRKTRYISTLLDTPVESITPFHHPVLEANKRKPFVETFHVIIPSDSSAFSSSTVSLVSTSSSSTLTSSVASTSSSCISSPVTFFHSSSSFPPYKRNRIGWLFSHNSNNNKNKIHHHHCHLSSLSPPPILPRASSFTTPPPHLANVNAKNPVSHLWTSRSDPHIHASFGNHHHHQTDLQQHLTYIDTTATNTDAHPHAEDEDDVPLAVLRTRNVDRTLESNSVHFYC